MPAVFVHGNPETEAIWDDLRTHLGRDDVVTLSPPGFGAPVPNGFGATADEYRDWLAIELERIGGDIDLVGHDWGGGHVMRIAMERPELIRSWATDIAGGMDPEYVWHDLAQVWGAPKAGEEAVAGMAAPRSARGAVRVAGNEQGDRCESGRGSGRDDEVHPRALPLGSAGDVGVGQTACSTRRRSRGW